MKWGTSLQPVIRRLIMAALSAAQAEYYRRFIMSRPSFEPRDFGVNLEKPEFLDQMAEAFNTTYRGQWSLDELLLHPREAARFCDDVRHRFGYYDVPDDIILRSIMQRRKNP
jgi:hypothetical protein